MNPVLSEFPVMAPDGAMTTELEEYVVTEMIIYG